MDSGLHSKAGTEDLRAHLVCPTNIGAPLSPPTHESVPLLREHHREQVLGAPRRVLLVPVALLTEEKFNINNEAE